MVDTKWMRGELADTVAEKSQSLCDLVMAAADEIDAGRDAQLVQYRCATRIAHPGWNASEVEDEAHRMLDAERAPEVW